MTHFQKPSGEKTGELINAKVSVFLPYWVPAILSLGLTTLVVILLLVQILPCCHDSPMFAFEVQCISLGSLSTHSWCSYCFSMAFSFTGPNLPTTALLLWIVPFWGPSSSFLPTDLSQHHPTPSEFH